MADQRFSFRAKPDDIPKGAVLISKEEALKFQQEVVSGWKNTSEVFALKFAPIFTSGGAAVASIMITNHYRRFLRLRNFGRLIIHLPTVYFPSLLSAVLHKVKVTENILLQTDCDVCVQVRSAALQVAFAVIYPSILAPLACFAYADRYDTYPMPKFTFAKENLNGIFQVYKKIVKKGNTKTGYLAFANLFLGFSLCFWEQYNFRTIHNSMHEKFVNMRKYLEEFEAQTKPGVR